MVQHLTQMTVELLDVHRKHNKGQLPERIIIYRDGVSEVSVISVIYEQGRAQSFYRASTVR